MNIIHKLRLIWSTFEHDLGNAKNTHANLREFSSVGRDIAYYIQGLGVGV